MKPLLAAPLLALLALPSLPAPVAAKTAVQSRDGMMAACADTARRYYRQDRARTQMHYDHRDRDRLHHVKGRIFLATRTEEFACAFEPSGARMTSFFTDGKPRPGALPGQGKRPAAQAPEFHVGETVEIRGAPRNDMLPLHDRPSSRGRVLGGLSDGDRVRILRCNRESGTPWCQVRVGNAQRGDGWVEARYLSRPGHGATAPSQRPQAGATHSERVTFEPGASSTVLENRLAAGAAIRFLVSARKGQQLDLRLEGKGLGYRVIGPGQTPPKRLSPSSEAYHGRLARSGDQVIEVVNPGRERRKFRLVLRIE